MKQYLQRVKRRIQDQWIKYIIICMMLVVAMTRNAVNLQKSDEEPVKLTDEQIERTKQYQKDTIIQYGLMTLGFFGILAFFKALNRNQEQIEEKQQKKNK